MNMAVSEKSKIVLDYLRSNPEANLTSADLAQALGMEKKTVDGVVTSGLIRNKGLVERVPAEIENADGTHSPIKLIKLTEAGINYDHEAALAQDAAAKAQA